MTYYMPVRRQVTGAAPLPRPRSALHHQMLVTAAAIGGLVDLTPERFEPMLAGCLLLPDAELIIAATTCPRPMLAEAAGKIAVAVGYDMLLLRFDAYAVDFDLLLADHEGWLERYRLYASAERTTFVSETTGAPIVFASPVGLMTCHQVRDTGDETQDPEPFAATPTEGR